MKFITYPNNNNFKVTGIEEVLYGYLDEEWDEYWEKGCF